jgi:prepilin-type N-terminal cleavage/methylation domain-containing protein
MKQNRTTNNSTFPPKGFTLVEVLLALAILSLCTITLIGLIPTAYNNITKTSKTTAMVLATQKKMDEILHENTIHVAERQEIPADELPAELIDSDGKPLVVIEFWRELPQPYYDPRYQVVYVEAQWLEASKNNDKKDSGTQRKAYRLTGMVVP